MEKMIVMLVTALCSLFTWQAVGATTEVASASALSTAISGASDGDIIKLTADITISSAITVSKSVTIDMSGRTITVSDTKNLYAFFVSMSGEGKTFKIDGGSGSRGKFISSGNVDGVFKISGGSAATVAVVNVDVGSSTSSRFGNAEKATGTFADSTTGKGDIIALTNVNVWCRNDIVTGSAGCGYASLSVKGGTFDTTKRGFRFCGEQSSMSVIDGASIKSTGGIAVYAFSNTMMTNCVVNVTLSSSASNDAISCSGSEHAGKAELSIWDTTVTVDAGSAVAAESRGNVTVNSGTFTNKRSGSKAARVTTSGGTITINGGTFNAGSSGYAVYCDHPNDSSVNASYAFPCTANINGGTFKSKFWIAQNPYTYSPSGKSYVNYVKLYISKGTFDNFSVDKESSSKYFCEITGGTFDADPTSYVDTDSYKVTKSGDYWTVGEKGPATYPVSVTCGLGVSGGTFTVDGTSYNFGATGVEAEAGKTVAITSITYKDYFKTKGTWEGKSEPLTSAGISWVVDAQAKTYPVSVTSTDEHVTGGKFTIDGGDEYDFGATGLTATNGAAVVVKEVYCASGYESSTAVPFTCEWTGSGDGRCIATVVTAKKQSFTLNVSCGANVSWVGVSVNDTGYDVEEPLLISVELGDKIKIASVEYAKGYGPSGDLREGYTTNVTGNINWVIVGEEESTTFSVTATAGTGVTGGKFAVGAVTNDFGTAMTDVADGSKVEIVAVNYALGYQQDTNGLYKSSVTNVAAANLDLIVKGVVVAPGAEPVLPADVKPQEAGITSEEFKDAQPAKVKEIVKWQASYSTDGANINAAEFTTDPGSGEKVPANDQAEAYLLDCAPTTAEIANAKTNFTAEISIDADGLPVVNVTGKAADATTYGNGKLIKLGAAELQNAEWSKDLTNAKFFKFELVK